jgi:glucose/mannose-6-phosphate isomerase
MKYQSKDLAQFPEQIRYAIAQYTSPSFSLNTFENIILCGLGGSGIAGRIAKSYFFDKCPLPLEVVSDYSLPGYAGKKTIAIMCSYSGNTEETLAMYSEAKAKGATIVCIATGGKLEEMAKKDQNLFYKALAGFQPRMALGYSLTYLILMFNDLTGNKDAALKEMKVAAEALNDENKYMAEGEKIFRQLESLLPAKIAVVSDYYCNPVGLRFCQQIQENAKSEAFLHELPESNHNVIESYYGKLDSIFLFLNSQIHPRTGLRFSFLKNLLQTNGNTVIEIEISSKGILPVLKAIYTLDWLSLLIADYKEVNSIAIKNINALKDYLGRN